ncbi:Fe(3+)-hydroxamate ABC transporter permease FhuB [Ensifer sp. 4252]|uniref:Fe(3+)-hydroxamate ABC transporter permease FhuB n=1 Tax=Ensifer sp. 4252 TaxID=3373915 RepID=UPI003D1A2E7A
MTRPAYLLSAIVLAIGLQTYVLLSFLPIHQWPGWPFAPDGMDTNQIILAYALTPRGAVAFLAGAALGLAGSLFQQVLRNPIADASTLGISSGAQLTIVAATLFAPALVDTNRELVALAGAAAAGAIVFTLGGRRNFEPVAMVISGLLVGITASAVSAALTLSRGEYLMSLVTWSGGSLSQQDWSAAQSLALLLTVCSVLAIALTRPLNLLGLGDAAAASLGVSVVWIRVMVATIGVVLCAGVSASVGLVGFIGLAAPHLVRASGARSPVAATMLAPVAGGLLLWICDGVIQIVSGASGENFPTGAITALIGGPLLLILLPKIRSGPHSETGQAVEIRNPMLALKLGIAALVVIAVLAIGVGRQQDGWFWLSAADLQDILPMRWPRLLAACAAGGLLALAGALLQRLTVNPMASPEVLGVSGGAGIGFAAVLTLVPLAGQPELFVGAGLGAGLAAVLVLVYAQRRNLESGGLLLAGVAISSISSSILGALMAVGDQRAWQILNWLGGSAATVGAGPSLFLALTSVLALLATLVLSRWLALLPLGDAVNTALGVPQRWARTSILLIAAAATGAASLLVGPLSFVGLMGPHIAYHSGFVTARQHVLASFVLGAMLMAAADFGSRTIAFPYELPLGLFAALVGAPYLIWQLGREK